MVSAATMATMASSLSKHAGVVIINPQQATALRRTEILCHPVPSRHVPAGPQ